MTNEQGQTTQAMVLGDTSGGTDGSALWAVSVNNATTDPTTGSETGWSEKARVEGNGDFVISGSRGDTEFEFGVSLSLPFIFGTFSKRTA